MSKFLSGRQSNLKLGVSGYTESQTVLQTTGKVGIGTTDAQQYSLYVVGDTNITDSLTVNGVNITGPSTVTANVNYADDIVVSWGDSEDLKIYHDSSGQSYIRDTGTGDLNLTSDGSGIHLQSGSGETLARFYTDGPVLLYYDGQQRLSTSGLGLTVTGAIDLNGNLDVAGVSTFTGLIDANGGIDAASAKVEDLTNDRIVIAGVGGELEDSPNLTFDGNTLNVVGHTELDNLNVSGIATINSLDVQTDFDVYDTTATFHNDLYVAGNLSIGGTTTVLQAQDLQIFDKDIILGVTTDSNGNDVSTDITANHGGVAIASTEGNPLVPFYLAGVNEDIPDTYKQIMWVKSDSYGFGTTDAWLFNYAVGIGSTLVPNGTRLAVSEIQFTDDTINAPNIDIGDHTELNTLNVSGVSTFQGNVDLGDNDRLRFGDSQDLQIYHNSSNNNSVIAESGSGSLNINADKIKLQSATGGETLGVFREDGAVSLNYDNSKKFETTSYGVKIYDDLNVGTGVTIYGNAGIVSAISFYGDGSNLTNTGATLGATSGTERLVTTQLTSGTMVDAATDADLTYNATTDLLSTPNIAISGGISTDGASTGGYQQLLRADGSGGWEWATVPGIFSVNNILNGFNVQEEGVIVGTAGSIHTLDFRGVNVTASADPAPNGIATITFSPTPTFDSLTVTGDTSLGFTTITNDIYVAGLSTFVGVGTFLGDLYVGGDLYVQDDVVFDSFTANSFTVSGIATFGGPISAGGTVGTDGQYLKSTGVGVTWASFPTLRTTQTNTATAGQTTFSFVYNVNFLDVFVNGVKLSTSEYTATNGTQIVLNTPAFANEIVEFHSYNTVSTGGGGGGGGGGASLLNDLGDVTIGTLSDDQLLQYNSVNGQWENVTVSYATEAFVGLATAGLASETYVDTQVGLATAGLASEAFVGLATSGLASETFVGLATAGLASETYVGLATAGLASETYVGLATAGLASETFVGLATAGLASEAFVGLATAGLLSSVIGEANVYIGDNPPGIGTVSGDLWWDSSTAKGNIYYDDGSSAQWVEFSPAGGGGSVGSGISYTDLSVTTTAAGNASLTYNNINGVFTYTPPDVSGIGTSRFVASNNTGSIGAGTTADITITGAKTYSLLKIDTSHAAWVRIYTDTTSRTNDATRAYTTDPTPGSGVLAEVYTTTTGSNTFKMTPGVVGWNDDGTPSTNIYAKVTNNESGAADITVSLTIVRMED